MITHYTLVTNHHGPPSALCKRNVSGWVIKMGTCCLSYQFYFDWPVTEKNARAIAKNISILGTTSSRSEVTVLTLHHQCQAGWIQLPLHNQRHLLHQIGGPLVNAVCGILDSDVAHLNDLQIWNQWPLNQGKVVRCNGPLLGHWYFSTSAAHCFSASSLACDMEWCESRSVITCTSKQKNNPELLRYYCASKLENNTRVRALPATPCPVQPEWGLGELT